MRLAANAMTNTGRAELMRVFHPMAGSSPIHAYREVGGTARRIWYLVSATDGTPVDTLMLPSASWDEEWDPGGRSLTFIDRQHGAQNVYRLRPRVRSQSS